MISPQKGNLSPLSSKNSARIFSVKPQICLFDAPKRIVLDTDRSFSKKDFSFSLLYRGPMSVGLHFADLLGYRDIALLGVDLHTPRHLL
jgi:hypothetical protein